MDQSNMMPEVIEAIEAMYKDHPDVEIDCMLFLRSLTVNNVRARACIVKWFVERDLCPVCGGKFSCRTYKQLHTELDEKPVETINSVYCPKCERMF